MSSYLFTNSDVVCLTEWSDCLSKNPQSLGLSLRSLKLIRAVVLRGLMHQLKIICINLPNVPQGTDNAARVARRRGQISLIQVNLEQLKTDFPEGEVLQELAFPYEDAAALCADLFAIVQVATRFDDVFQNMNDLALAFHRISQHCTLWLKKCREGSNSKPPVIGLGQDGFYPKRMQPIPGTSAQAGGYPNASISRASSFKNLGRSHDSLSTSSLSRPGSSRSHLGSSSQTPVHEHPSEETNLRERL